jgi:hypothetical protein
VDISARQGIGQILDYRDEQDILNVGSSAGYQEVIESATNGNLHEIIAGKLNQNGNPIFNGEQQKKDKVDSLRARIGHQGQYYALADSNGDRTLIEGAHKSGGAGIGIGSSIEEAKEKIDQATYYVGDSNPEHELTGALISHLSINEPYKLTPQELRKEYGFDYKTAEIQTGELADKEDRKILNNFLNQLN